MVSRPLWQGNLSFGGEYTYTDRINNYVNEQGILNDDHSNIREDAVSAFVEYARRFGQVYVMSTWFLITTKTVSVSMNKAVRTTMCSLPAMPVGKAELSLSYTSKSKYKGTGAGQEQRSRM